MTLDEHRTAVVTGAASGIGLALSHALLRRGLDVVMADVETAALDGAARRLEAEHPGRVLPVLTDVSDQGSVQRLRDRAVERFGPVDLLCNNAGVTGRGGPVWRLDERDWAWALGVNLWGVIHGLRTFLPDMVDRDRGHVLNVASLSGLTTPPYTAPYNATKHAVVAVTETVAMELALTAPGVRMSVACPGLVDTGIWHAERNRPAALQHGQPEDETYARFLEVFTTMIGDPMDPAVAAERMLAGVDAGDLHVLTHPHMHHHAVDRLRTLEAALTGQRPSPGESSTDAPPEGAGGRR